MELLLTKAISNLLSHPPCFKTLLKPMLDHGPGLREHISSKGLLKLETFTASREADALKILDFDVNVVPKVTITLEAPGISSQLGTHQVSIKFD